MSVVIVCPNDDVASKRLGTVGASLAQSFPALSSLLSNTRTRSVIDRNLRRFDHILYLGHGERDTLLVPAHLFRQERILIDASNIGRTGRVVIAVACNSSAGLGTISTSSHGGTQPNPLVESYVGWLDEVGFPRAHPDPILDALRTGLEEAFHGQDMGGVEDELKQRFGEAHDDYRDNGVASYGMAPADKRLGQLEAKYWEARLRVDGDRARTL